VPSATHERILDATLEVLTRFGITKLTLEDVASAAEMSRQTVYRYFGNKDELTRACLVREEERFLQTVLAATEGNDQLDLRVALERAFTVAIDQARAHPLLDRLLATEPHALLPLLLTGEGPVLSVVGPVIEQVLAHRLGHLSDRELHRVADATSRLLLSYAINPAEEPTEDVASSLADLIVHGIKTT